MIDDIVLTSPSSWVTPVTLYEYVIRFLINSSYRSQEISNSIRNFFVSSLIKSKNLESLRLLFLRYSIVELSVVLIGLSRYISIILIPQL